MLEHHDAAAGHLADESDYAWRGGRHWRRSGLFDGQVDPSMPGGPGVSAQPEAA